LILLDYSQVATSTFFALLNNSRDKVEPDVDFIRHLILKSIGSVNVKFRKKYGKMVVCVDGGNSWRKQIFPYYKAARKKARSKIDIDWTLFYASMETVKNELDEYFPYNVIHFQEMEADDIIGTLSLRLDEEPNIVISSDKDFIQLQAMTKNTDQYDNINKRFLKVDDPKRYLYDHVMSGDRGDGVPNVLSDDDTFVVEGKRQKSLGPKKLEQWFGTPLKELFPDQESIQRYNRNKRLIDLRQIPKQLQIQILEKHEEGKSKTPPDSLFNYFSKFGLVQLLESVGDFK